MHENNPVARSRKLFDFFGWQGGTIHQVAQETGVDVDTLLYAPPTGGESKRIRLDRFTQGCLAAETCGTGYRLALVPQVKGDRDFWIGVACSIRTDL